MTFDDMVQLVTVARQSGRLTIDVANFAPAAVSRFSAILDTALLELERVNVMMLAPGEIRMGASLRVGIRIDCELRFYREASGIGYTMTFGTRNALALLKGDMQVLRGLVDIDTAWWTASSRAIESLDVAITGLEAKALSIREGLDNLHLRLGGAVLKALTLADSIFDVVLAGNIPSFSVTKRLHFALPPALQADFRRITVTADGTVTFDAQVALKLLGVAIPPMDLTLALSPVRIAIRFPLPDVPLVPGGFPIQAVRLTDTHVELNGTLGASGYGAAMDGRYILPGGSGHGGRYRFEYNAGNTSPLPDTFELGVDRLTATDALNLVSPFPVRLPAGIDRMVKIQNGYAYYAVGVGAHSASGVPLEQGATVRASVTVFGAPSYLAADVRNSGFRVAILTDPLRLGKNFLAVRGMGVRPPAQYAGPAFAKDAIGIEIDTIAQTARAALIVDVFGATIERMSADVGSGGITIETETTLPGIARVPLAISVDDHGLGVRGSFEFGQSLDLPLANGFNLTGPATISGTFHSSSAAGSTAKFKVSANLKVVGFSVGSSLEIDADDIRDLAERIFRELCDAVRRKLLDAVELVRAFLEGAVKYTLAAADAARELARYLVEQFKTDAAKLITVLQKAGATARQAIDFVRGGAEALGRFALDAVVVAVRNLYSAVDALDALRHWAEQFAATLVERAENVAWLLRQGGYAVEVIAEQAWSYIQNLENKAEALVGALTASAFKPGEVARALQKHGIPVDVAGKVLGPVFGTDILEAALLPAYGPVAAARVANAMIKEFGRFSRNVGDEFHRLARRLGLPW